ncbi:hypothetical protein JMJ35_000270 [Cladonia borealis]|uniref:Uncharacterized protein n=1 Tax=Cladonia borealis TaxID=184061 RepID=A0AA39RAQ5_9LECA|nr:hypothetical protein JMJ35_000270 [Cladonia borealis]
MHLLPPFTIIIAILSSLLLLLPTLTTCAPAPASTNITDPTKSIILSLSPTNPHLEADTCPTPPTEFLPYPPPPGYTPGPGCPPASEGTQPT